MTKKVGLNHDSAQLNLFAQHFLQEHLHKQSVLFQHHWLLYLSHLLHVLNIYMVKWTTEGLSINFKIRGEAQIKASTSVQENLQISKENLTNRYSFNAATDGNEKRGIEVFSGFHNSRPYFFLNKRYIVSY